MPANPTTTDSQAPARGLHEICEDVRRAECGACPALPGDECVFTSVPVSVPVTPGTAVRAARGYHVNRFAIAEADDLISIADMAVALEHAGAFTSHTVIFDDGARCASSGENDDARCLREIRDLLAHFDWEHHDRQLALEAIERIVEDGQA